MVKNGIILQTLSDESMPAIDCKRLYMTSESWLHWRQCLSEVRLDSTLSDFCSKYKQNIKWKNTSIDLMSGRTDSDWQWLTPTDTKTWTPEVSPSLRPLWRELGPMEAIEGIRLVTIQVIGRKPYIGIDRGLHLADNYPILRYLAEDATVYRLLTLTTFPVVVPSLMWSQVCPQNGSKLIQNLINYVIFRRNL